jgi:hypothetical protein
LADRRAAERFQVARTTATKWSKRYRELGPAGMVDLSSRPHRSPRRTPQPVIRRIVHLRWKKRLGPVAIAARVGLTLSTVHRRRRVPGPSGKVSQGANIRQLSTQT